MRKIGELKTKQVYFVLYYDEKAKVNPFRIYRKYWNCGWKKQLLEKYGDLYSCTIFINDFVSKHNTEDNPWG